MNRISTGVRRSLEKVKESISDAHLSVKRHKADFIQVVEYAIGYEDDGHPTPLTSYTRLIQAGSTPETYYHKEPLLQESREISPSTISRISSLEARMEENEMDTQQQDNLDTNANRDNEFLKDERESLFKELNTRSMESKEATQAKEDSAILGENNNMDNQDQASTDTSQETCNDSLGSFSPQFNDPSPLLIIEMAPDDIIDDQEPKAAEDRIDTGSAGAGYESIFGDSMSASPLLLEHGRRASPLSDISSEHLSPASPGQGETRETRIIDLALSPLQGKSSVQVKPKAILRCDNCNHIGHKWMFCHKPCVLCGRSDHASPACNNVRKYQEAMKKKAKKARKRKMTKSNAGVEKRQRQERKIDWNSDEEDVEMQQD